MTLFILTETSAGYALLKSKDKKLLKSKTLSKDTETAAGVCELYVVIFFIIFLIRIEHVH